MIADILIERIEALENPTVVGLDPTYEMLPACIKETNAGLSGTEFVAKCFLDFNTALIDAVCDIVPAVKPQVAFYEKYGAAGIKAYIDTIAHAKKRGLIVIGDVKRGDIASTAAAYSDGHLGMVRVGEDCWEEVYKVDYITAAPYIGRDSILPFLPDCKKYGKGLFVLVKTSNPNSGDLQDLNDGEKKVFEHVGLMVNELGKDFIGEYGYSSIGAVVGATHPGQAAMLRGLMPNTFFLIPGYGAQGGKGSELAVYFNRNHSGRRTKLPSGGIVNSSRGIIAAYQLEKYSGFGSENFDKAAKQAAIDMKDDLHICLK